jgi:5'-AMP-activated protein kinase catalytic alpha subunit
MYNDGDTLKTACGSPCYAAPEMIAGKRYHGLNSDIWSCGIILYAMTCGYLPFEDPNTSHLYKKILN